MTETTDTAQPRPTQAESIAIRAKAAAQTRDELWHKLVEFQMASKPILDEEKRLVTEWCNAKQLADALALIAKECP